MTYFFDGSTWIDFAYDALGRLVRRVKDGWDGTYNYYDGEKELLECGSGGGAAFKNVYGKGIQPPQPALLWRRRLDEIVMRTNNVLGGVTFYYQQDHEGNVTHLTSSTGTVLEKYQYDAFGAPTIYNASGGSVGAA